MPWTAENRAPARGVPTGASRKPMTRILNVHALPKLVDPRELARGTVVVIDVLRATTTIVYALEAGAREIVPCPDVEEAWQLARQFPDGEVLLGGERGGLPIKGFDLGNSPEEYAPPKVRGKLIVFTTTNGTQAIGHARLAGQVLIGAFVNASAVVRELLQEDCIHLLCAGTEGQFGEDDLLLAGMLVDRLVRVAGMVYRQNAQAVTAREFWLGRFALPHSLGAEPLVPERLAAVLRRSLGGRKLVALGLEADVLAAAHIDRYQAVPYWDPRTGRIRLK